MLKIVLNQKDAVPSYRSLFKPESESILPYSGDTITITGDYVKGLLPGDKLRFVRTGCNGTWYFGTTEVIDVDGTTAVVKRFKDNVVKAAISEFGTRKTPNDNAETFLKFDFYYIFFLIFF